MSQVNLDFEAHRRELTGYCYRMLGSAFDADDAVQETMVRAWKRSSSFEGRASVRTWLYKIATNVCLDALRGSKRRALPMDLGPASPPRESLLRPWSESDIWVTPICDDMLDPAEIASMRDSVRLAFVVALQHLPPRQRAVLILCAVLRLSSAEAAAVLETSVPAVNSALQRARATLAALPPDQNPGSGDELSGDALSGGSPSGGSPSGSEPSGRAAKASGGLSGDSGTSSGDSGAVTALLDRYVDAFQRYDMAALMEIIHEDAVMTMPPFELWLRGNRDITAWMVEPTPSLCRGSVLVPVSANGVRAWGQYKPAESGTGLSPWALQVHETRGEKLSRLTFFLDTERLFPLFGLPDRL